MAKPTKLALTDVLKSRSFSAADCDKRISALAKDRDHYPAVRELVLAHGSKAEDVAYAYIERLPWDEVSANSTDIVSTRLAHLLLAVVPWGSDRTPKAPLTIQRPDLLQVVRSISLDGKGDLGRLAVAVARFAQNGNATDRAYLVERAKTSTAEVHHWYCGFASSAEINERMFEVLAARYPTVEEKFDWIVPRGYTNVKTMYVAACAIARELKLPKPVLTLEQQALGAFTLSAILRVVRAYEPSLLGKYGDALKMPLSMTKSEKQALLAEFAADCKAHKAARVASEKAAAKAAAKAAPKPAPMAAPSGAMPRYNREVEAALLVYGRFTTAWIKADAFKSVEQKVEAARAAHGIPLVCVPCGVLPAPGAKRKHPQFVADKSINLVVGVEVGRADKSAKTSAAIQPTAFASAQKALKKLPGAFWTEAADALGQKLGKSQQPIVIAAGLKAASLVRGKEVLAVAERDNGGLMTSALPGAGADMFVVPRAMS